MMSATWACASPSSMNEREKARKRLFPRVLEYSSLYTSHAAIGEYSSIFTVHIFLSKSSTMYGFSLQLQLPSSLFMHPKSGY